LPQRRRDDPGFLGAPDEAYLEHREHAPLNNLMKLEAFRFNG